MIIDAFLSHNDSFLTIFIAVFSSSLHFEISVNYRDTYKH